MTAYPVDTIYVAASRHDARFTRICVASIRHVYPDVPVELLAGGPLEPGLAEELARYWNVGVADLASGDYGWGFVKLEPLFMPPGHRFLILDSDTIITGLVLDLAKGRDEDFIVDDETQSPEGEREIYFDRALAAREGMEIAPPAFLFNSGQWFGTSGKLRREDFADVVTWGMPPRLVNPRVFKNGDQGVINFVFNNKVRSGEISVARVPLMRWPGHGLEDLDLASVQTGRAPPLVIHWAGLKRARLGAMKGADFLLYFERQYYARLPQGALYRAARGCSWSVSERRRDAALRAKQRLQKLRLLRA